MRLPVSLYIAGVCIATLPACSSSIVSVPIEQFDDGPVEGVVYHLPKTAYTVTSTVRLETCPGSGDPRLSFQNVQIDDEIVPDLSPSATYAVDAESFRKFAKKIEQANVQISDGTIEQVNFDTVDQTGEIVADSVGLVAEIAGISTPEDADTETSEERGNGEGAEHADSSPGCTPYGESLVVEREALSRKISDARSAMRGYIDDVRGLIEDRDQVTGTESDKDVGLAQKRLKFLDSRLEFKKKELSSLKDLITEHSERLKAVEQALTRTVKVKLEPPVKDDNVIVEVAWAPELHGLIASRETPLYRIAFVKPDGAGITEEPEEDLPSGGAADAQGTAETDGSQGTGIFYRIPRIVGIDFYPLASAPDPEKTRPIRVERTMLQGGRRARVPLSSQEFESGRIALTFDDQGWITQYTYKQTEAPGVAATAAVTGALDRLVETEAEERAAEIEEAGDEQSLLSSEKSALELRRDILELEKEIEELEEEDDDDDDD